VNYGAAIDFLYGLRLFGAKFGLENTFQLARLTGDPQKRLRFIHVAGTNGKGSTCAMLESVYRQAGWKVGLFTSPHLNSFRERIQIDRQMISEADVVRLVSELQPIFTQFAEDHHPTFFEVVTIMALKYFAEQEVDLVIWETGLGGRLDATNIVTPLASVITNIAFDHQQWLGDTIAKIASEKAGIIKAGVPVATTETGTEALEVITKTARRLNAPLRIISPLEVSELLKDVPLLSLAGEHQHRNAGLAVAVVDILRDRMSITPPQIEEAMANVYWPGRLQLITHSSGQKFLLDGAHNEAGAESLRNALQNRFVTTEKTIILGVLQDKNWKSICALLAPLATRILLVPVSSDRTSAPEALAAVCRTANPGAEIQVHSSFSAAFAARPTRGLVVITGSLYLIGEAMEVLGIVANSPQERGLNEWLVRPRSAA
jgi:dihydrofolate synthase/folylpolyglutamate synthase